MPQIIRTDIEANNVSVCEICLMTDLILAQEHRQCVNRTEPPSDPETAASHPEVRTGFAVPTVPL